MRKIETVFVRDPKNMKLVTAEVTPGCEWVFNELCRATRKYDGTCCLIRVGEHPTVKLYKRCEWDNAKGPAPASWLHWSFDPEQRSGHGWLPISDDPSDWLHREAFTRGTDDLDAPYVNGQTYELCGPKIQKNPEGFAAPVLVPHGRDIVGGPCGSFEELRGRLGAGDIEGIVWHHADGRMAKIKARDFGFKVKPR